MPGSPLYFRTEKLRLTDKNDVWDAFHRVLGQPHKQAVGVATFLPLKNID
jgi:hypothetical protein